MSYTAVKTVRGLGLRGAKHAVLLAYADRADDRDCCWPGLQRTADDAGVCLRTARLATRQLEIEGLLSVYECTGSSNVYQLHLDAARPAQPRRRRRRKAAEPRQLELNLAGGGGNPCRQTFTEPPVQEERTGLRPEREAAPVPPIAAINDNSPGQPVPAPAPPAPRSVVVTATPPAGARALLWSEGLAILFRLTGLPHNRCRPILGRLLTKAYLNDDCVGLLRLLVETERDMRIAPVPWLMAAAKRRGEQRRGSAGAAAIATNRYDRYAAYLAAGGTPITDDHPRGFGGALAELFPHHEDDFDGLTLDMSDMPPPNPFIEGARA